MYIVERIEVKFHRKLIELLHNAMGTYAVIEKLRDEMLEAGLNNPFPGLDRIKTDTKTAIDKLETMVQ